MGKERHAKAERKLKRAVDQHLVDAGVAFRIARTKETLALPRFEMRLRNVLGVRPSIERARVLVQRLLREDFNVELADVELTVSIGPTGKLDVRVAPDGNTLVVARAAARRALAAEAAA